MKDPVVLRQRKDSKIRFALIARISQVTMMG